MKTLHKLLISVIAFFMVSSNARANHHQTLAINIAIGILQYIEWTDHESAPHAHTLCILDNTRNNWLDLQKKYTNVKSITNIERVKHECDAVFIGNEYSQFISGVASSEGPKETILISMSMQGLVSGAHFSLIKDGEIYKIYANSKNIQSTKFLVSSKLLRLVKAGGG